MAKSSQPEIRTRWSSKDVADRFTVDNPATGAPPAVVQGAGDKEVDQAVQAAYDAHFSWKTRTARRVHVHIARLGQGLAVVAALQGRDLVGVLAHRLSDLPPPTAALARSGSSSAARRRVVHSP